MQNKGFVKVFALLLTLVCVFYLSFSVVTSYVESKAQNIAQSEGEEAADRDGYWTRLGPEGWYERHP